MFRTIQSSDAKALSAFCVQPGGITRALLSYCCGSGYGLVQESEAAVTAAVLLIPASIGSKKGVAVKLLAAPAADCAELLQKALALCGEKGAAFAAAAPADGEQLAAFTAAGMQKAYPVRTVSRDIRRNLWSRADFDSTPVHSLMKLRTRFCPDIVQFDAKAMTAVVSALYAQGITIVSSDEGYGLYYRKNETLHFIELMASDDTAADCLMEAARTKEVVAEHAVITVSGGGNLYLGEGVKSTNGAIAFFGEPFDVSESFLSLITEK